VDPVIMPIADLNILIDPDGQAVNMAQAMAYRTLGPIMALANVATCLALWFSKRSQSVANRQS
jgi:hypothetical protein